MKNDYPILTLCAHLELAQRLLRLAKTARASGPARGGQPNRCSILPAHWSFLIGTSGQL
jgi:hypothetical protein